MITNSTVLRRTKQNIHTCILNMMVTGNKWNHKCLTERENNEINIIYQ